MVTKMLPVNKKGNLSVTINARLKEERNQLRLNQTDFAALGGKTKKTLIDYEKGKTNPDAEFLAAIAAEGADVQYVLTGIRSINLPKKPITTEDHLKLVKATTEATNKLSQTDAQIMNLRDLLYAIETDNAELIDDAIERLSGISMREKNLLESYRKISNETDKKVVERMVLVMATVAAHQ